MKKVVVGLGNPGSRYAKSRHNIGWLVLDRLADRVGASGYAKARDGAATARGRLGDDELILVKPTTYVNLSGGAVRKVLARERVPMRDMLVVVDDMALPFGRLRMRSRGSDGGHNGLRSIIAELESQSFARLRVGIGAPARGAVEHVLGDFEHAEERHLELILDAAADAVELWATAGPDVVANRWNGWTPELAIEQASAHASGSAAAAAGPPASGSAAPRTAASSPGPDADGIVRTRTGWRRLLPELLAGRRRDETR